jgi:hypothetical protein
MTKEDKEGFIAPQSFFKTIEEQDIFYPVFLRFMGYAKYLSAMTGSIIIVYSL